MTVRQYRFLLMAVVGASLAILMLAAGAQADTLTYTPTPIGVQQTANNPCVIGDPSCDTNTKQTFPLVYTSNSGPCNGGAAGVCDFSSPVYVASSSGLGLPNIIPTSFDIGVDENLAAGHTSEILDHFYVWLCNSGGNNCNTSVADLAGSATIVNENNGNGYTDGILSHFTLVDGNKYVFEAVWHNDSDGMEQFWIISPTTSVPEPGTLSLLGMGLLGIAGLSLRKVNA